MMNIVIRGTGNTESLNIYDPSSGVDYIQDFVGNMGAFRDGQFTWDDERGAYLCDQDTFDWWVRVATDNQAVDNRLYALRAEHGTEAVHDAVKDAYTTDLEHNAASVHAALDDAFGADVGGMA